MPISPKHELVHMLVHISRLSLLGPRMVQSQADATDCGMSDPVQGPTNPHGTGCHVDDLKTFNWVRSWGQGLVLRLRQALPVAFVPQWG